MNRTADVIILITDDDADVNTEYCAESFPDAKGRMGNTDIRFLKHAKTAGEKACCISFG
jgi:hypothetical protein